MDKLQDVISTSKELEIRLSSNVYYLGELMNQIGNVEIEKNETMTIDLREILEDLEDIRQELETITK